MAVTLDKQKYVQIADEAVAWGTAGVPTQELSGITDISFKKSIVTNIIGDAQRGGIVPGRDTIAPRHEVDGCSIAGHVIYEQIPWLLQGLDEIAVAGVGPYTYTFAGPTTAQPVPRPQTLVSGPTNDVQGLTGMCIKSITISWNWGEGVTFSADLMGHNVESDTFAALDETAAASLTYALASHLTVYVDAIDGTMGDTTIEETQSGSITIDCQRKYIKRTGDLYPTGIYDDFWNVTGEIVIENTAESGGFVDAVVAGATTKQIELDFDNGGAGAAERSLLLQFASEITFEELWSDSDGMSVVKMTFKPIEHGDWTTVAGGDLDGYFAMVSTSSTQTLYA